MVQCMLFMRGSGEDSLTKAILMSFNKVTNSWDGLKD